MARLSPALSGREEGSPWATGVGDRACFAVECAHIPFDPGLCSSWVVGDYDPVQVEDLMPRDVSNDGSFVWDKHSGIALVEARSWCLVQSR